MNKAMEKIILILILILGLVLAIGCGGDDEEGNDSDISLPVSADTPASEMTEDEAMALCVEAYDKSNALDAARLEASADETCAAAGYGAAALELDAGGTNADIKNACEGAVRVCEEAAEATLDDEEETPEFTVEDDCEDYGLIDALGRCDINVGVIGNCLEAALRLAADTMDAAEKTPECSELTAAYLNADAAAVTAAEDEDPEIPGSCQIIMAQCSGIAALMASAELY